MQANTVSWHSVEAKDSQKKGSCVIKKGLDRQSGTKRQERNRYRQYKQQQVSTTSTGMCEVHRKGAEGPVGL
jgi:hypothetical protein